MCGIFVSWNFSKLKMHTKRVDCLKQWVVACTLRKDFQLSVVVLPLKTLNLTHNQNVFKFLYFYTLIIENKFMHQYFNIEYSARFMNIHKIIPYKCLLIWFKTFSWHRHYCSLNIVVHVIIVQFFHLVISMQDWISMKGQWYSIGRRGYHSASPVTWLRKTIRTAQGLNNLSVD